MRIIILIVTSFIFTLCSTAQVVRQNELFKDIPVINNKVAFVKEVKTQDQSIANNYTILRKWARDNYGKDPFVSSVRYDERKNEIVAKSRVELVLPENKNGIREKIIMRYRVDAFIFEDKCVLQVTELSFLNENAKDKKLPRVIRAEDFIVDEKIEEGGALQELRVNARKSTLYFLNTLGKDFEEAFGY